MRRGFRLPVRVAVALEGERRRREYAGLIPDELKLRSGGARSILRRIPAERRRYAEDPWAYFFDVLGVELTRQQEEIVGTIYAYTRSLFPSGNNLGKTFVLGGMGLWVWDARAALEGVGRAERGARVLLPGPDAPTVFSTIYSKMLTLAELAEGRGFKMPGQRSEKSVTWRAGPEWEMEAFHPPPRVQQNVAHTASGRHHVEMIALMEEGQGVPEPVWRGTEGMCSGEGNRIAVGFNSTEPIGPAFERSRNGVWKVVPLSALDHPNVRTRSTVVPAAISHRVIDGRVASECRDVGPWPGTELNRRKYDFVYALPPGPAAPERGGREDGIPGHPDGIPRVYRPVPGLGAYFIGQVLGQFPEGSDRSLFDPAAIDEAQARWKATPEPPGPPDAVGIDTARSGGDEIAAVPRWGQTGAGLLRRYAEMQKINPAGLAELRAHHRIRLGEVSIIDPGNGVAVGDRINAAFPVSPLNLDDGGVGASPFDYLASVIGRDAVGVSFAGIAPSPIREGFEPHYENLRACMLVRFALLVNYGLVDLPPDPKLREELLALEVIYGEKTRDVREGEYLRRERVRTVRIIPKAEVKKRIGRSPDRADGAGLALHEIDVRHASETGYIGTSYQSM